MRVALIWESIPECTDVYVIEDLTPEQLSLLENANGKHLNCNDDDTDAIVEIDRMLSKGLDIWDKYKTEFPVTGPIDKIFITGYYM